MCLHICMYHIYSRKIHIIVYKLPTYFISRKTEEALVSYIAKGHIYWEGSPIWEWNNPIYDILVANISNNKELLTGWINQLNPYDGHHSSSVSCCGVMFSLLSAWYKKSERQTNWRKHNSCRGHLGLFFGKKKKSPCIKDSWRTWR